MEFGDIREMIEIEQLEMKTTFLSNLLRYYSEQGYLDYQHEDGKRKSWLITEKGIKHMKGKLLDML